ncbi:DUF3307 domain-containing protein [Segetibacter koreensis]|uniref:DUF3307 domain-containing protein n=1 Tax=Segetibacter koreensis TaxID=398037 RepID=UPI00035DF1E8|nr:DUF3307 domain-containing protein [Segetibacter koreensis]
MNSFFSYTDGSIVVKLLMAHCITDFFLQPNSWVTDKKNNLWGSRYLYLHVLITGIVAWLLLANIHLWPQVLLITLTHLLIDGLKVQVEKYLKNTRNIDFRLFITDQVLHITVIIIAWLWIINGWVNWTKMINGLVSNFNIWVRAFGYIFVTSPVGYIIQFLTRKWNTDLAGNDSLPNAGKWIGVLERLLILTMVFIDQFSAIGFLVAAKSILRVTDKPDKPTSDPTMGRPFSSRKHTEYVLIGTFLSVGIAIFTGLVINALLRLNR